jgi:hypothetical protein
MLFLISSPIKSTAIITTFLLISLLIYFIPTLIAFYKKKRNRDIIFVLNLFLGWTFLGWLGALVWALVHDPIDRPSQEYRNIHSIREIRKITFKR